MLTCNGWSDSLASEAISNQKKSMKSNRSNLTSVVISTLHLYKHDMLTNTIHTHNMQGLATQIMPNIYICI